MSADDAPAHAGEHDDEVDGTEWVYLTTHAEQRFRQRRAEAALVGPRVAWFDGVALDAHGTDADEVRYHAETRTVLVRRGSYITTALGADHATGQLADAIAAADRGGRR